MTKYATIALFTLMAACGGGDAARCEIADCATETVDACKTAVDICNGVSTCIDGVITSYEIACDAGGDTDS